MAEGSPIICEKCRYLAFSVHDSNLENINDYECTYGYLRESSKTCGMCQVMFDILFTSSEGDKSTAAAEITVVKINSHEDLRIKKAEISGLKALRFVLGVVDDD